MNDKDKLPLGLSLNQAADKLRQSPMEQLKNRKPNLDLKAGLFAPPPEQTGKQLNHATSEFKDSTFLNLNIEDIDLFDGNPRHYHDPEAYQATKESIRHHGIQQPVHITKRPNAKKYILSSGGNTRLKILKELFAETKDIRFSFIPCIYKKYTSEEDMYVAHMIENEQRADMCFWDKANGYAKLKNIIEQESNKKITSRELSEELLKRGLTVSYSLLSLMLFSLEKLNYLGHLTQFLSYNKVFELRKLFNKLNELIKKIEFESVWQDALQTWVNNNPYEDELDLEVLSQFIESEIRDYFGLNQQNEPLDEPSEEVPSDEQMVFQIESDVQTKEPAAPQSKPRERLVHPTLPTYPQAEDDSDVPEPFDLPESTVVHENDIRPTLIEAKETIHTYVKALLNYVYLNECFVASDDFQYGFYVELPDFELLAKEDHIQAVFKKAVFTTLIDCLDPEARDVYWFLADLSGQMDNWFEDSSPIYQLPDHSLFRKFATDEQFEHEVKLSLMGDRASGSNHIINWTCNPSNANLNLLFQQLVNSVRLFNLIILEGSYETK